jgi:hypothetical protein
LYKKKNFFYKVYGKKIGRRMIRQNYSKKLTSRLQAYNVLNGGVARKFLIFKYISITIKNITVNTLKTKIHPINAFNLKKTLFLRQKQTDFIYHTDILGRGINKMYFYLNISRLYLYTLINNIFLFKYYKYHITNLNYFSI